MQNKTENTLFNLLSESIQDSKRVKELMKQIDAIIEVDEETLNETDEEGMTPLHIAINRKLPFDIIKKLIESGANLNLQDNDGNSALHLACLDKNMTIEKFKYLIEEGNGDLLLENQEKKDVYQFAISNDLLSENVREYLEKSYLDEKQKEELENDNSENNFPVTKKMNALSIFDNLQAGNFDENAIKSFFSTIKYEESIKNEAGQTPLHIACLNHHILLDILNFMINYENDNIESLLEIKDNNGNTPLHIACANGNFIAMQQLVYFGASIHSKNEKEEKPFDLLSKNLFSDKKIISLFEKTDKDFLKIIKKNVNDCFTLFNPLFNEKFQRCEKPSSVGTSQVINLSYFEEDFEYESVKEYIILNYIKRTNLFKDTYFIAPDCLYYAKRQSDPTKPHVTLYSMKLLKGKSIESLVEELSNNYLSEMESRGFFSASKDVLELIRAYTGDSFNTGAPFKKIMTSLLIFHRFFTENNLKLPKPIQKQIVTMGLEECEKEAMIAPLFK